MILISTQSLAVAVKWVHAGNVYGDVIPLVLLLAVDSMHEDDFYYKAIPGLSHTGACDSIGYICCTKTRAGNAAFGHGFLQRC